MDSVGLKRWSGLTRRFRFGESSDNVAQLSELLAERRFSTQVTLNEIAENENYRSLSRTIFEVSTTPALNSIGLATSRTRLRFEKPMDTDKHGCLGARKSVFIRGSKLAAYAEFDICNF